MFCQTMKPFHFLILLLAFLVCGCTAAQQRGMNGNALVSTSRPAFEAAAKNLPLLASGEGTARLMDTAIIGGLPVRTWMAVYGKKNNGPFAIIANAEVPSGWQWDGILRHPFSVDESVEIIGDVQWQACTYIAEGQRDPFLSLLAEASDDNNARQRWLVRSFASRQNFGLNKIILEYREPLHPSVQSLTALPYGKDNLLSEIAQRGRNAFDLKLDIPVETAIEKKYIEGIRWQYLDKRFLGTASPNITLERF